MEKYDYIWVEEITYTLGVFRKLLEGYEGADPGDHWGGTDAPDAWECGEDSRGEGLSRPPPFFLSKNGIAVVFWGFAAENDGKRTAGNPRPKKRDLRHFLRFLAQSRNCVDFVYVSKSVDAVRPYLVSCTCHREEGDKMKVYLVLAIQDTYEGYLVMGVFSNRKAAEREKERLSSYPFYCEYEIEEWDLE